MQWLVDLDGKTSSSSKEQQQANNTEKKPKIYTIKWMYIFMSFSFFLHHLLSCSLSLYHTVNTHIYSTLRDKINIFHFSLPIPSSIACRRHATPYRQSVGQSVSHTYVHCKWLHFLSISFAAVDDNDLAAKFYIYFI